METINSLVRTSIISCMVLFLILQATWGYAQRDEGKSNQIIEENRKLIQKNPNDVTALNNLGATLIQSREYQEAIENLLKAIQINPSFTQAHFNLGLAYHNNQKYKEAADEYQKAMQYGLKTYIVCYNLGIVLVQLDSLQKAQKWYGEAITLKSDYPNAYYNLAETFIKLKDTTNAISNYEKYLNYASTDIEDRDIVKKKIDSWVPEIDKTPPIINITKPKGITKSGDVISFEENEIIVSGTVTDNQSLKKITINNKNIPIGEKNLKEKPIEERVLLKIGRNEIKISALDGEGNEVIFSFVVKHIEPDTSPPVIVLLEPKRHDSREKGIIIVPHEVPDTVQTDSIRISGLVDDKSSFARLTVRNREIQLNSASDVDKEKFKFTYPDNVQKFQTIVPLDLGKNEIVVMATDVKGNTASDTLKITRKRKEFISQYYRKSWAILVGVNNYENEPWRAWNLNYADDDAIEFAKKLREELGFEKENITLILDEGSLNNFRDTTLAGSLKRATGTNIRLALENLTDTNKVSREDRVLIYFSGHGHTMSTPQSGEMGFIIPEDFSGNNIGAYDNRAFPMNKIRDWSNYIPAKHVLFLVDACYSGLAAQLRAPRGTTSPVNYYANNIVKEIITAGNKTDKAVESPEIRHGVFTYMILKGLEGKADTNQDSCITADELSLYLRNNVPYLAEQYGGKENPKHAYFNSDDEGEFIFELRR